MILTVLRYSSCLLVLCCVGSAAVAAPIVIGISAEYGVKGSQAAQSIEKGVKLAAAEINAKGGLLGGRQLQIVTRDDRGVPARGMDNLRELAALPEVVAVFCGRFSPVAIEQVAVANREHLLLLDPWAAADGIANNGGKPNYVFRLSLTDTWAIGALGEYAQRKKWTRLALFLPNTAWGRSSLAAFEAYAAKHGGLHSDNYWYNFGDSEFTEKLLQASERGAGAILLIANELEGALIVKQMAALPQNRRLPLISHWGITGGDFAAAAGEALQAVDLRVVQTFSFQDAKTARAQRVAASYRSQFGEEAAQLQAVAGFAHAYDLTQILALAITKAGSTQREAVRNALENLGPYAGLLRDYPRPFSPSRHEALDSSQVFLARFGADGILRRSQDR